VKAAALRHSLTRNHPLVDNKRAGQDATSTFIENAIGRLTVDFEVHAAEQLMLDVASGVLDASP
jgi:prophage maintenance system killer protein